MRSHALDVRPGRLLTRLAALGFAPDDSEEERLTKAVLTLSACLVGVLSFVWVITYFAIGQPLSAAIPLAYQVVSLVSLVVFSRTKRVRTFRASQLAMILVLPFLLQLSLGGFVPSSGVILWALIAPIGALMFFGESRPMRWFVAYGALVAVAGLLQPALPAPDPPVPQAVIGTFFVMNILGVSTTVFLLLRYFVRPKRSAPSRAAPAERAPGARAAPGHARHDRRRLRRGDGAVRGHRGLHDVSASAAPAEIVGLLNELFSGSISSRSSTASRRSRRSATRTWWSPASRSRCADHASAIAHMALDMIDDHGSRRDRGRTVVRSASGSTPVGRRRRDRRGSSSTTCGATR